MLRYTQRLFSKRHCSSVPVTWEQLDRSYISYGKFITLSTAAILINQWATSTQILDTKNQLITEINGVKSDVANLKSDVANLKSDVRDLTVAMKQLSDKVDILVVAEKSRKWW